jgi:hypothetical protein
MGWRGRSCFGGCVPWLSGFTEIRFAENIALATGALAGAVLLLGIQILFELRADESTDFITAEYTIDRTKPEIRQWNYGLSQTLRFGRDLDASGIFAGAHPGQFNGDGKKLTLDMVLFSLLAYLGVEQFDWQIKRTRFVGQSIGTVTLTAPGSKPGECTEITKDQLHRMLLDAGNSFADGNMFLARQSLCLPPRSTLQVRADGLILTNPFCEISFILEPSASTFFAKPGTHSLEQPLLPTGEPTFETRATGIRVTVRYSALRAQHLDMPKYRDWSNRIVSGAQRWFMDSDSR